MYGTFVPLTVWENYAIIHHFCLLYYLISSENQILEPTSMIFEISYVIKNESRKAP